jgi:predicted chitinase
VEPDSSIDVDDNNDQGLEFVSPPLPIEELLSDLNKVKAWADRTGCYTNDSTGLHINVSVPGWTQGTDQLDYVKLALLLGDEFVLDSFGRAGNTYAKSAMGKIVDMVRQNPNRAQLLMNRMKQGLDQLATRLVHGRQTEKYTSINVKNGYIEFRSPGGDWLNDKFPEIENTLRRFTVALSAAVDPAAYRQEYLKKLYKLLDVSGEKDPLSYFAKYAAGQLPKAALKSFVRQAQLDRDVKRDKTGGKKMWWSVTNPPQSSAGIEVVATSREEAIEKALGADGYPAWANTRQSIVAKPLRPYEEPAAPAAVAQPIPGSTLDLQRQRAAAAQGGMPDVDIDLEPAPPPAPQQPGMGQWNGQWRVLVGGREVYRFGNIGNSQADANRIAAAWLRSSGRGVSGEGFEVYPVMTEDDLEESWRSALAGAAATAAMAFTPAPANSTAAPTVDPAAQPAAVQQSPGAAAESALSRAAQAAGIKGVELAQFLAQCAHETGDFAHLEELGGNRYLAKYDPSVNPAKAKALGNTQAGDGARYKGRGFIQITGKANYATAGQALGIDLVNNPEAAAKPDVAAKVAVWYWQNRVAPYVQDFSDTRGVTKRINPGLQGLQDRQSNFQDYQQQVASAAQPTRVAAVAQPGAAV